MQRLPIFGIEKIALDGSDNYPNWIEQIETNLSALQARVGDTEEFVWAGQDGTADRGTVVCVSEPGSVAAPGVAAVAEAVDHAAGGSQWLRRPVGLLLTPYPSDGDNVRVRLLGRAWAPVADWTPPVTAGDPVYLKAGTLGDYTTYGQLTMQASETNALIVVGKMLVSNFVYVNAKISIT